MAYKYKCNKCGFLNTFASEEENCCKQCNLPIDKEICALDINEKKLNHLIIIDLINENYNECEDKIKKLQEINENNEFVRIMTANDILNEWLKEDSNSFEHDVIFRYYLKGKYENSILIEKLKSSNLTKKEQYINLLNGSYKQDSDLLKEIDQINATYYIIRREKKTIYILPYIMIVSSFLLYILFSILGNLLIPDDCRYGSIVLLDLIPSFILTFGILKLINKEKIYFAIPLFLFLFLLLSYIFTINLHVEGFADSILYHFERIIYSFRDIADSINKNIDNIPDEIGGLE